MRKGTTDSPKGVISWPLIVSAPVGVIRPHELLLRIPNTARPRPSADSPAPTTSSGVRSGRGPSRILRTPKARMAITTTVSPANTSRQVQALVTKPPISGPAATPAPAIPPSIPNASARSWPV